ncbi:hypothetical protein O6H91_20G062700 [Diphasiastrum complanatum]|uniref:Uncharacterized protein n=1 Tax=Diphasiastrum complanatum TaxID=34168 RepID=A0ACC2AR51_DIPCM|nr:hypothetical protein O6H91_20G062700 [Diphasiastrum complanatum]
MGNEEEEREEVTVVYKIKPVQFLGRPVPIILQNDNGPCPLLAICNVLLLRNNLSINPDIGEISLQNLLSHIAERLLDANSNVENKDDEYVRNQQQNISDAITLLPRLATGIDVNVRFRHIHDFEFTPECAIFDLLDIGLVHGWLCDPQDEVSSRVIGDNSYNVLVEKLVALESSKADPLTDDVGQELTVDFAAATTASLGIPSPSLSLSRMKSLEGIDFTSSNGSRRKGDDEEAAQLLQALQLSDSGVSETSEIGSSFDRFAIDDLLSKKQENNGSLSSHIMQLEPRRDVEDFEQNADSSSNRSIGSGEISPGKASSYPLRQPTSSSCLLESTSEIEHDLTSFDNIGRNLAETETFPPLKPDVDLDSLNINSEIHEQLLADRMNHSFQSSTSTSDLKVEGVSSDVGQYIADAFLPLEAQINLNNVDTNSEMHAQPLAAAAKQTFQSSMSTSDLKAKDASNASEELEKGGPNLELWLQQREDGNYLEVRQSPAVVSEDKRRLSDAYESSRLSFFDSNREVNCLSLADTSQSSCQVAPYPLETAVYNAAEAQAIYKEDQFNLDKEVSVVGSESKLEMSGKQGVLEMSEASNAGVDPSAEGACAEDAREETATAHASDSMEEPLYEGETMLSDAEIVHCDDSMELLYEGEGILVESADKQTNIYDQNSFRKRSFDKRSASRDDHLSVSVSEGYTIENFLRNHASQLTYYGLFSLQEGLKERELCVFFRNNHFSTMFKYEGDLYLLATDQGYLNQPDLVWEKLTEVDGDSVFFTGNFSLFKADENHGSWSERDAVVETTGFISAHQKQDKGQLSDYNTDLQLAMALQQEELDQQQQQQHRSHVSSPVSPQKSQSNAKPSTSITAGRLFTGPKSSTSTSKVETKSKDKCAVM